jgi:glucose-1-phosphate adenylyltransferase
MHHFATFTPDYYLILAGDHLYRMDLTALVDAHLDKNADLTIAAQPVAAADATDMGIFRFDRTGKIDGFEEKPDAARLQQIGGSVPRSATMVRPPDATPFVASMGIYVFSRDVLSDLLASEPGVDFGREIIPAALTRYRAEAYLHRGYWADVGTIEAFYDANIMLTSSDAPFQFYDPHRPIYTHPRFLPGSRFEACAVHESVVAEGCGLSQCTIRDSVVGIRTQVKRGARISRSVLLGADSYEAENDPAPHGVPPMGIGRDAVLDRVIVDKNARIGNAARLVNERNVQHEDGDGYCIRGGIIVVPKNGIIREGTVI